MKNLSLSISKSPELEEHIIYMRLFNIFPASYVYASPQGAGRQEARIYITKKIKKEIKELSHIYTNSSITSGSSIDIDEDDEATGNMFERINERYYLNKKNKVLVSVGWYTTRVFFVKRTKLVEKIVKLLFKYKIKFTKEDDSPCKIFLLCSQGNNLSLRQSSLRDVSKDIDGNYNEDLISDKENIIEKLQGDHNGGILLLHGEPDTGKTTFIKHLTSVIDKQFIMIPISLVPRLSSPDFLAFLTQQKPSILVLEEAEKAIADRGSNNNSSVGELLSISDGLLGDVLNFKLIITFNVSKTQIDPALLRKGRLIGEFELGKLSVERSNTLLEKLGKEYKTVKPMTLAEIYNIDEIIHKSENKYAAIGFNSVTN